MLVGMNPAPSKCRAKYDFSAIGMKLVSKKVVYFFPVFPYYVPKMNNEMLDQQNETHALARVTPEELPGYADWCAQWETEQDQDWGAKIEAPGGAPAEDRFLDSYLESRFEME